MSGYDLTREAQGVQLNRFTGSNQATDRYAVKSSAVCPYCQRRFETPDELTLHIVTRHTQAGIQRGAARSGR